MVEKAFKLDCIVYSQIMIIHYRYMKIFLRIVSPSWTCNLLVERISQPHTNLGG